MGIGAAVFAAVAIFFFLRIGGETPFNHLVKLFGSDAPAAAPKEPGKKPTGQRSEAAVPKVARNAKSAPSQDQHSERDQKSLDDLVEARTR